MGIVGPGLMARRLAVTAGAMAMGMLISGCPGCGTTTTDTTSSSSSSGTTGSSNAGSGSSSSSTTGGSGSSVGSSSRASSSGGGSSNGGSSSSGGTADCAAYCTNIMAACTGDNAQYPSQEVCMAACSFFPAGMPDDTAGNSLACRAYHASVANNGDPASPGTHCPHAGPDGDGVCGTVCEHYCDVVINACTGANEVYADRTACNAACNSLNQTGGPADTSGDSVQCRAYHAAAGVALMDLATHCPHSGINSDACFDTLIGPSMIEAASGFDSATTSDMIQVVIGAGALSGDTTLTVTKVTQPDDPPSANILASGQFVISTTGNVTLSSPMTVTIPIDPAPVHPQLAEVYAVDANGNYTRIPSFYRDSDQSVVFDTTQTNLTIVVAIRTLQAENSPNVAPGRDVFMFETFGNQNFFSDTLGLHEIVPYLPPSEAVALGAQVNLTDVPDQIVGVLTGTDLQAKDDALDDPAVTAALLRGKSGTGPGAVVGVVAFFDQQNPVNECPGPDGRTACPTKIGISCALCHVTVAKTTFNLSSGMTALPIGAPQFDGKPNLTMNAGAILALTPAAQDGNLADLLMSWGPGRFDIRALPDNPLEDNANNPTQFPPLWNFVDLEEQSYTYGWDGLFRDVAAQPGNHVLASQAEAVYDLVMHANGAFATAQGNYNPPELDHTPNASRLAEILMAESRTPGNDITTMKLDQVQSFERSITSPAPGTFDEAQALAGFRLFFGKAACSTCHSTPEFTGMGRQSITATPPAGELGEGIKVAPLRGISQTAPYFHDGSAATLADVIARYVARGGVVPTLSATEQAQLVEYLKSL